MGLEDLQLEGCSSPVARMLAPLLRLPPRRGLDEEVLVVGYGGPVPEACTHQSTGSRWSRVGGVPSSLWATVSASLMLG